MLILRIYRIHRGYGIHGVVENVVDKANLIIDFGKIYHQYRILFQPLVSLSHHNAK